MFKNNRIILIAFILVLLLPFPVQGEMSGLGLGIVAGEPTGLSVKKWMDVKSAIDGALAWSFIDGNSFQVHADYLRHKNDFSKEYREKLPLHYGIGARIKFKDKKNGNDDTKIGIRVPLGISYFLKEEPIDIFIEIVPILNVSPETDIDLNAAVGVRYYIK